MAANAFALLVLGDQEDQDASTIVAVKRLKTEEAKKSAEEHKKIVAQQKKIAEQQKKAEAMNKKSYGYDGNAVNGQRYINNNGHHQRNGPAIVLSAEEKHKQWLANRELWLVKEAERNAKREQWLGREEERKKDAGLKTLKEYEEQHKAEKSTSLSVPESTPLKEAARVQDDFQTKQKSKNGPGPATERGTQDSRKNMNNGNYKVGYSKRNQDSPLPGEDKTVKVKPEPAAAPDLSATNFPVLGRVEKPTKSSVKHIRKDNNNNAH